MTVPDGYTTTFKRDARDERPAIDREGGLILPAPNVPMEVAREFARACFQDTVGRSTVQHWRGGWWEWRIARWVEIEQRAMAASAYRFTEHAQYEMSKGLKPWAPNRYKVADLLAALAAVVHLPEDVSMPTWLDGTVYDGLLVSCANGLLDVNSRAVLDHTPLFFNGTSVPFAYDPRAARPVRWRTFLNELWPGDPESCSVLQGVVRLRDLWAARPAQDPPTRRAHARRQGGDRASAGRACWERKRRRPDAVEL